MAQKGKGGQNICTASVRVTISKTKLDETNSRDGVKCLLNEARTDASHDFQAEIQLNKGLQQINPNISLALMARKDSSVDSFVETKFEKVQLDHSVVTS